MRIKEIIVVEGKDDTVAIKRAVDADTIETNGSAINQETIEKIKLAQKTRGVIVLTDPDFPGQKIRYTITAHVPECKHAFIDRKLALKKNGKGLGVEHASPEVIRDALKHAHMAKEQMEELISKETLIEAKLIGFPESKERRERLGKILSIGYANGKQLHIRLKMFHVSMEDFLAALKQMEDDHHE